jgi:predicted DNA-binding transcriptional regulator AlpA
MGTKKKYMTVKEYATRFSLNQKTVYNKIERGEIKTKKVLNTTLVEV